MFSQEVAGHVTKVEMILHRAVRGAESTAVVPFSLIPAVLLGLIYESIQPMMTDYSFKKKSNYFLIYFVS